MCGKRPRRTNLGCEAQEPREDKRKGNEQVNVAGPRVDNVELEPLVYVGPLGHFIALAGYVGQDGEREFGRATSGVSPIKPIGRMFFNVRQGDFDAIPYYYAHVDAPDFFGITVAVNK